MKKKYNFTKVYHSENFNDVFQKIECEMPFPFTSEMISLCKKENPFKQEYYYIENAGDYAFFILYYNRLNIFTLGKKELIMNVKTIGYPCSLSNCGYVTNNLSFMLDFIKTIKGGKLVLNVINPVKEKNMVLGETLPTCVLHLNSFSVEAYMNSLRSPYRRRIRIAKKHCETITVQQIEDDNVDIYELYQNTYEKSEYKLEKLNRGFFDKVDAVKLVFYMKSEPEKPIGFVLLKKNQEKLIFMLCGMDYSYPTADLYYFMLYNIIAYAINNKCRIIDLGQTSEQTKMKLGAVLEKRYFYAAHSNVFLNLFAKMVRPLLEYRYSFPEYRVMKEPVKKDK